MNNKTERLVKASMLMLFILLSLACASSKRTGTIPDNYSEIVEISGTKDMLYTNANLVFVDLFNNADSVVQFSDKEAGVMKGKYVSSFSKGLNSYKAYSTVEVSVKEGKYKISLSFADIILVGNGWVKTTSVPPTDELLTEMNKEWKRLAEAFKTKMNKDFSWE